MDAAVLEEMKNFVNDNSVLTQHVGNGLFSSDYMRGDEISLRLRLSIITSSYELYKL